jgi:hypothetical protein
MSLAKAALLVVVLSGSGRLTDSSKHRLLLVRESRAVEVAVTASDHRRGEDDYFWRTAGCAAMAA